jgi:hypothetical protein
MMFLPGNLRGLDTHPQLSVIGCELPQRRLMAKNQEGRTNVETPGRLLDSYWKGTTSPTHCFKRINEPTIIFSNLIKPKQELPMGGLSGSKLEWTNLLKVRISHRWQKFATTRPVKKTRLTGTRMGPQIHHSIMGTLPSNMAFPQWRLPRGRKRTSQTLQTRRTRTGENPNPDTIHRTTITITSLQIETLWIPWYGLQYHIWQS